MCILLVVYPNHVKILGLGKAAYIRTSNVTHIQSSLAYAEMRLILARLVWNFDVRLADGLGWDDRSKSYLLWQKGSINAFLKPRFIGST